MASISESVMTLMRAIPNAFDKSGLAPVHTRCAAAVSALIDGGATSQTTGRGENGSSAAKKEQARNLQTLEPCRD